MPLQSNSVWCVRWQPRRIHNDNKTNFILIKTDDSTRCGIVLLFFNKIRHFTPHIRSRTGAVSIELSLVSFRQALRLALNGATGIIANWIETRCAFIHLRLRSAPICKRGGWARMRNREIVLCVNRRRLDNDIVVDDLSVKHDEYVYCVLSCVCAKCSQTERNRWMPAIYERCEYHSRSLWARWIRTTYYA